MADNEFVNEAMRGNASARDVADPNPFRDAPLRFREIESAIAELEPEEAARETTFTLDVATILKLLPPAYVADPDPADLGEVEVAVTVDDLLRQLARGKVTVAVDELVQNMPLAGVSPDAYADHATQITIPLSVVVRSVDPSVLSRYTATLPAFAGADALPDPFDVPEGKAGAADAPRQAGAPDEPERAEHAEPEPEMTEPAGVARLGGVDINAATREQLLTLEGVTPRLADAILNDRRQRGPFADIFALRRVPGLGRIRFRQMSGMPYSQRRRHRVRKLVKLLGVPVQDIHRLPLLAERIAGLPGFGGCVLSDADGLVIASHGIDRAAEALAAVAPRMLQRVQDDMAEIQDGTVSSVSICLSDRMYTVVREANMYVAVAHSRRRLTKQQIVRIERIAAELAWLLSHRAYAAPISPSAREEEDVHDASLA